MRWEKQKDFIIAKTISSHIHESHEKSEDAGKAKKYDRKIRYFFSSNSDFIHIFSFDFLLNSHSNFSKYIFFYCEIDFLIGNNKHK